MRYNSHRNIIIFILMVVLGTEIKINVHIDPIGDVHMSQYDFECDFYANSNKRITINKSNLVFNL